MELAQRVILLLLAAAVGEGINEFFFLPWFDGLKVPEGETSKRSRWCETVRIQCMRLWSGAVGIFIAWQLSLEIFGMLGATLVWPVAGYVLTGLVVGRGSNYLHELLKRYITER